jgi:4-amino-4-deoxy-L-arabinose transferase-like glycosyltransferase
MLRSSRSVLDRVTTGAPAALVLAALTIAIRLPLLALAQPIDDEVNYSVVARQLIDGGRLYVDVVERRPPLTFWLYSAVFRIFGEDNWLALHAVALVWVLLTMFALYVLAARLFGTRSGFMAAALYSVFQPWWYWGNLAFNGEVLMNLPVAAAFALSLGATGAATRWRYVGAGALVATGFLLKQPAAVAIVPLAIYLAHPAQADRSVRGQLGDLAWLAGGCLVVLGAIAAWLVAHGLFADAWYWSILDHDTPHIFVGKGVEHTGAFLVVTLPMLAAVVWSLRHPGGWSQWRAERDALVCLFVVSAVGAAESGRFFPHYYIGLLPALAVLAAPAATLAGSATIRPSRAFSTAFAWTAVVAVATLVNHSLAATRQIGVTETGHYLREQAAPDERVFVWGRTPKIYLDSDRRPAARYIDTFPLTGRIFGPHIEGADTTGRILPGAWDRLREDFAAHPPAFIVDTQSEAGAEYPVAHFPWLATLLQNDYAAVAELDEGTVYRRMPRTAASRAAVDH